MVDDVSRIVLDRNISISVTDHTGRAVNLSMFGTLQSGDIADVSREIRPIQPRERQYRPVSYRISLTFEQAPQGAEALRQMPGPLTIVCTILREGGETQEYKFDNAWLDFIEARTVAFVAKEMTRA